VKYFAIQYYNVFLKSRNTKQFERKICYSSLMVVHMIIRHVLFVIQLSLFYLIYIYIYIYAKDSVKALTY